MIDSHLVINAMTLETQLPSGRQFHAVCRSGSLDRD